MGAGEPFAGIDLERALGDPSRAAELVPALHRLAGDLSQRGSCSWRLSQPIDSDPTGHGDRVGRGAPSLDACLFADGVRDVEINVAIKSWTPRYFKADSIPLWRLSVDVAVMCECARDHGEHVVDSREFEGGSGLGLDRAVGAAIGQIESWITQSRDADAWRRWAGLPTRSNP